MMPRICFTVLLIFTLLSIQVSGQESLYSLSTPAPVNENYFFDYDTIVSGSVTLSKTQNPNNWVDYIIGISSGSSGDPENRRLYSSGGSSLSYLIVDSVSSGNILKDIEDNPLEEELLKGTVRKSDPATAAFDIILSGGEFPPPGYYYDSVMFKAYIGSENTFSSSSIMDISVTVPTIVSLSLTEAGGSFIAGSKSYFLDFGFMSAGDRGFIDMIVAANVPYSISLESAHSGNLANTDSSDSSLVPYSIIVDSSLVNLSGGSAQISSGTNPTPVTGNRHSIEIEILDIDSASSGNYEDTIQVIITAL